MCETVVTPTASMAARADFQRARRAHLAARALRRLAARRPSPTRPRDLGDIAALTWGPARQRAITLDSIVGTVDPTADFDAGFRPATNRLSSRWESIARAHRAGRALPPIAVIERPDGYYVIDGRHRVSVARALGHRDIDASTSPAAPTAPARPAQSPIGQQRSTPRLTDRLRVAIARALSQDHVNEPVHFHAGDHGHPYVCENPRCSSPSLRIAPS